MVNGRNFLDNPFLKDEVFGPYSLIVRCKNEGEMNRIANQLNGQLTTTIIANEKDIKNYSETIDSFKENAGRIVFNGVPTGVDVCRAMQHGGPYPATTDSRFTAVGEDAVKRWLRPVAYQDCPKSYLPDALKNKNSLKIRRIINGKPSRKTL